MKITIVGGGNIGTQFAVHCAEKGHEVTVVTSKPEVFDTHLSIVDENGNISHEGDICCATNDPAKGYKNIAIESEEFMFENYGITDMKSLKAFYMM